MATNPYAINGFMEGFDRGLRYVRADQDRAAAAENAAFEKSVKQRQLGMQEEQFGMQRQEFEQKQEDRRREHRSDIDRAALSVMQKYEGDPDGAVKALAPLGDVLKKYNDGHGWESYQSPEMGNYLQLMDSVLTGQKDRNDPSVLEAANWRYRESLNRGTGKVDKAYKTGDGQDIPAGSTIDDKKIARIVAGPEGTVGFDLIVTGTRPDGSKFSYSAPLTDDRANGGSDNVKLVKGNRVFDKIQGDAMLRKLATSPGFADILKASYLAHGGKEKDLEDEVMKIDYVTGDGVVTSELVNKRSGETVRKLGSGKRYGLGSGSGASAKQVALIEHIRKTVTHEPEDNAPIAAEMVLTGNFAKTLAALIGKYKTSGLYDSDEEAIQAAKRDLSEARGYSPFKPDTAQDKARKFPPSAEGRRVRDKKTGKVFIVVDGELVPLENVPEEARPSRQPKAKKSYPIDVKTQRKIGILESNIDNLLRVMRKAEKDKDIETYRNAQRQIDDYRAKLRELTTE